jgi:hypothetical protein
VAKGKPNSAAKIPANSSAKRKTPPSNKDGKSAAANKQPVQSQPEISNEQIGHVAGDLWRLLDKEGGQSLAAIKKATGASNELVLAAIGWLAREDKLEFTTSGRTATISLRQ